MNNNNNNALLLSQGNENRNGNGPLGIHTTSTNTSTSTSTSPVTTAKTSTSDSIPATEAAISNNPHNEILQSGQEEHTYDNNEHVVEKANIWAEVIESSSGEAVALYKTREEAEECFCCGRRLFMTCVHL